MSHDDFAFEPQRGLPGVLPPGEQLLWQGTPNWRGLAVRSYHVRKIAAYFAVLVVWRIGMGVADGQSAAAIALGAGFIAVLGAAAVGTLAGLSYLNARSAVYSITSRRVLVRQGIAVPLTLNIPFRHIEAAGARQFRDGTGDIALTVGREQRIAFLINWPHLKPGQFTRPEPSFRALDDAPEAARILGSALAADSQGDASQRDSAQSDAAQDDSPAAPVLIPRSAAAA